MPAPELVERHPPLSRACPARAALRVAGLLCPTALFGGCAEDKPPDPPLPPPELTIQALQVVGGGRWSPGQDESLVLPCAGGEVLVELGPGEAADEIGGWILRPPGACSGIEGCGFVSVTLDPGSDQETAVDSASRTVAILLTGPGDHRLFVEFRRDDGSSPDLDGGVVSVELEFAAELPPEDDCAPTDART